MKPLFSQYRYIIIFSVFGILLSLVASGVLFFSQKESIKSARAMKLETLFEKKQAAFNNSLKHIDTTLASMAQTFEELLGQKQTCDAKKNLIDATAATHTQIAWLGYIDDANRVHHGVQRIHTYEPITSTQSIPAPLKTQLSNLHAKHSSTPHTASIFLQHHDGELSVPLEPILPFVQPIYVKNSYQGVLLLNYFIKNDFNTLIDIPNYETYLIDNQGCIISSNTTQSNYSTYLNSACTTIQSVLDASYAPIFAQTKENKQNFLMHPVTIFGNNNVRMVIISPTHQDNYSYAFNQALFLFALLVTLTLVGAFYFARTARKRETALAQTNQALHKALDDKKRELLKLNEDLEQTVAYRTKEQRILLSLFDTGNAVLFRWNNDAHWSCLSVSKSVSNIFGYGVEDFMQKRIAYEACIHPDDLQRVTTEVSNAVYKKASYLEHAPYRIVTHDGITKWVHDHTVLVQNDHGEVDYFIGYITDITALKEHESNLQTLAHTDQLTQLFNRMHMDHILEEQLYRYKRNAEACSIILCDLDHFKNINDAFGHIVGDAVLIECAEIFTKNLRQSDIIGRWGGEEFLFILAHTDLEEALNVAHKIQKNLEAFTFIQVGKVTASFGVATFADDTHIEQIIERADKALYEAKHSGRNCVKSNPSL